MIKKTCPNGHIYDQSIYGDTCPLCPSPTNNEASSFSNPMNMAPGGNPGAHTKVIPPNISAGGPGLPPNHGMADPTGSTKVTPEFQRPAQATGATARTTIRHNSAMMGGNVKPGDPGRKLVGFLVTYNRTPMGKAYNIYEGRNYVGRDASCEISVPDDTQMSGKHMLIRYLSGNNKFSFRDEMSSNGTYVNKVLLDEGELQSYDIIRVGSTLFIFIAIPQI